MTVWYTWGKNPFINIQMVDLFKLQALPVTTGGDDPLLRFDPAIESSTPALVPTQIRSLHASNDVTRRQAALCCRIMSSQFDSILFTEGAKFTSKITS